MASLKNINNLFTFLFGTLIALVIGEISVSDAIYENLIFNYPQFINNKN